MCSRASKILLSFSLVFSTFKKNVCRNNPVVEQIEFIHFFLNEIDELNVCIKIDGLGVYFHG